MGRGIAAQPMKQAGRRPYVIIRRAQDEVWTALERAWLKQVLESPVWQKLMRFSDDSICCDILDGPDKEEDLRWVRGFVAGRKAQIAYQCGMGRVRPIPEPPDPEREPDGAGAPVNQAQGEGERAERVSMQEQDE